MNSVDERHRANWAQQQADAATKRQSDDSQTSTSGGGGGTYGPMEARVKKLEDDMNDVRVMLARIDERTAHMLTKADLSQAEVRLVEKVGAVETRVGKLEGALEGKLGVWQFITVMGGSVALILAWPALSKLLGV